MLLDKVNFMTETMFTCAGSTSETICGLVWTLLTTGFQANGSLIILWHCFPTLFPWGTYEHVSLLGNPYFYSYLK